MRGNWLTVWLARYNVRLISCQSSPLTGQVGCVAERPAYKFTIQSLQDSADLLWTSTGQYLQDSAD